MAPSHTPDSLSAGSADEFIAAVGGVYEKSPWVAERAFSSAPFASLTALTQALKDVVENSTQEEKIALLCAHPDLAGKAALAGELTAESTSEQASAGLDTLSSEEMARFTKGNDTYKSKFGFPFILAVRGASKSTILNAFDARIGNSQVAELSEAIWQVHKIAWMRLRELVKPNPTGFLTCHVLDTAQGCPAAGMAVELSKKVGDTWQLIERFVTNSDGRLGGPALKGDAFVEGIYEFSFAVGPYFATAPVRTAGTPFLTEVPIRFGIDNPEDHYHVPLLCSPWSFSTYRGS